MEYSHILLRYGEIFLKGKNRHSFEQALIRNIYALSEQKNGLTKIRSRMILPFFENHKELKRVFGLVSYSLAFKCDKDIDDIKRCTLNLLKNKRGTFRISTQRSDKRFSIKSPDVNRLVGEYICENTNLEFSLKEFDLEVHIEINEDGAYVFFESVPCFGGLPVGTGGKVASLIDGSQKSLLSTLLIMKRGVAPFLFSKKKMVASDFNLLQSFSPKPLKRVVYSNEDDLLEKMRKLDVLVLVCSEQFSSFQNFNSENEEIVVLRPLIAFSDEEIEKQLSLFQAASLSN